MYETEQNIEFSRKHKININRINREIIGSKDAIYPEVDNVFQQLRSKIIWKIKCIFQK